MRDCMMVCVGLYCLVVLCGRDFFGQQKRTQCINTESWIFNFCFNPQILYHLGTQNNYDTLRPLHGQFPQALLL